MYPGCTDQAAANYRSIANLDDGSCVYAGCINSQGINYNPSAIFPAECIPQTFGCMDSRAANYYPSANNRYPLSKRE